MVSYDSTFNQGFLVHKADSTTHSKEVCSSLMLKMTWDKYFFNTVDNNKFKYTIKEYADAVGAHTLQDIIEGPSTADFIKYTERCMIPNCPNTKADILKA